MGNCQAATVLVQHPGGRVQRLYWTTSATEVMHANPGHYVTLVKPNKAEQKQEQLQQQRVTRQPGQAPWRSQ
jgi:hypothetical protein